MAVRSAVHARGLRYRLHARPLKSFRRRADLVFRRARVAVFVDGCFWHGCLLHGSTPKTHRDWWRAKLQRTRQRDRETNRVLEDAGWRVIRVWEHEDAEVAADRVEKAVRQRQPDGTRPVAEATGPGR